MLGQCAAGTGSPGLSAARAPQSMLGILGIEGIFDIFIFHFSSFPHSSVPSVRLGSDDLYLPFTLAG